MWKPERQIPNAAVTWEFSLKASHGSHLDKLKHRKRCKTSKGKYSAFLFRAAPRADTRGTTNPTELCITVLNKWKALACWPLRSSGAEAQEWLTAATRYKERNCNVIKRLIINLQANGCAKEAPRRQIKFCLWRESRKLHLVLTTDMLL